MTTRPSGSPTRWSRIGPAAIRSRRRVPDPYVTTAWTDGRRFVQFELAIRGYCNGCGTYTPEGARCPGDTGADNHVHWPFTLWLEGRLEEL